MNQTNPLFKPFQHGKLALRNRIVMSPMTRYFSPDNIPGDNVVEYYRRRAEGGVGLIITEGTCIQHDAANGYDDVPFFYGDKALAGWKKVVEAVHAEGAKIIPQLWHVGLMRNPKTNPKPGVPGYGPSTVEYQGQTIGHEMTKQDIDDVIRAYAEAALSAKQLGFDGLEIHAAHGYLIDQFFWLGTNKRTDSYGGSMANRSRFAIEIIRAIRAEVGPDFPVSLRWSQWKGQDYTARLADSPQRLETFLSPLVDAGVDLFHCSTRRFWESEFEDSDLNLAGWVKKLTGQPTITVGSVGLDTDFFPTTPGVTDFRDAGTADLENLQQRLGQNEFDLVAVGRALIANPDWPQKVYNNQVDELKPFFKEALKELV